MKKISLSIVLVLLSLAISAQTYFKNYKSGTTFYEKKDYKAAIEEFTVVIDLKTDHDRAFNLRGLSYMELGEFEKAAADFKKATGFKPKMSEYHFNLGKTYYQLKKYKDASTSFTEAINRDKKLIEAYELNFSCLMHLKQYQEAVENAEAAISVKKTGENYYLKGVAQDSLMQFSDAAYSFGRAVFYSPKLKEAYVGLAHANLKLAKFDKAIAACDKALQIEGDNVPVLLVRAEIHIANKMPQKAVEDLSKIILEHPNEIVYYLKRGSVYQDLAQHQNAVADFTKAISIKQDDYFSYYQRAQSYESLSDFKSAIADYEKLKELSPYDGRAMKLYDQAKKRLYELNKESNNPKIEMIDPVSPKEGIVQIPQNSLLYKIRGQIKDESNISFIKVNGKDASFNKDTINPYFEVEMNVKDIKELTITAFDVYQNSETWVYKMVETEVEPPVVKLMAPYASDDGTVYLDADDPTLYVEGIMNDESLIKSILVEGATASYVLEEKNPKFSATINIMNKDGFTITAVDQYGNKVEKKFTINRENIELLADNPMGKTWVVFIENSNYQSFASLDGPTKDVTMMKSAFAKYKIHNIVHKQNMTKAQLERFFSIELRDLVRSNRVKSLLVWYAGHGKFINESG